MNTSACPSGTSMMPLAIVLRSTFPPEYPKFGSLCINPPPPILFPEINPPVFPTASPTDQPPDFFFFLSPTGSCSLSLPDGRRRSTFRFSVPLFPAAVVPASSFSTDGVCSDASPCISGSASKGCRDSVCRSVSAATFSSCASRERRFVPPGAAVCPCAR